MNAVRELRERLGISQEKAARLADISCVTWRLIENGKHNPSLPVAKRMAKVLGTTIDDLFN